jgi:hypothetical protein
MTKPSAKGFAPTATPTTSTIKLIKLIKLFSTSSLACSQITMGELGLIEVSSFKPIKPAFQAGLLVAISGVYVLSMVVSQMRGIYME